MAVQGVFGNPAKAVLGGGAVRGLPGRGFGGGPAPLGSGVEVPRGEGGGGFPPVQATCAGRLRWHRLAAPFERPHLRLLRAAAVRRHAVDLAPDAIIERYHNFGGEGMLAAATVGAVAVLEVNAPVVDHPGSRKALLDRTLLVRPMQRWRERLCGLADLLVTPSARILPPGVAPSRVLEVEWGADTDRFRPGARGPVPFERRPGETVVIFAGAFRAWHGAPLLAEAVAKLERDGVCGVHAVFVGDGPERPRAEAAAASLGRVTFAGALPYDAMPACLAAADIGVAPFDAAAHPPLQIDFYWSPLKVFEYMAAGLPVVAPRLPRLAALVEDGRDGLLYDPARADGLAEALRALLGNPERRQAKGRAARAHVERAYSWRAHFEQISPAITRLLPRQR